MFIRIPFKFILSKPNIYRPPYSLHYKCQPSNIQHDQNCKWVAIFFFFLNIWGTQNGILVNFW